MVYGKNFHVLVAYIYIEKFSYARFKIYEDISNPWM